MRVPLTVKFDGNDVALVNVTVRGVDYVHGSFTCTYSQVLVNATTKLKLIVIDDRGLPANETQIALKLEGHLLL